jgi:hypothetical protein
LKEVPSEAYEVHGDDDSDEAVSGSRKRKRPRLEESEDQVGGAGKRPRLEEEEEREEKEAQLPPLRPLVNEWINELPTTEMLYEKLAPFAKGNGSLLVIDDFMQHLTNDIAALFTVRVRYRMSFVM